MDVRSIFVMYGCFFVCVTIFVLYCREHWYAPLFSGSLQKKISYFGSGIPKCRFLGSICRPGYGIYGFEKGKKNGGQQNKKFHFVLAVTITLSGKEHSIIFQRLCV